MKTILIDVSRETFFIILNNLIFMSPKPCNIAICFFKSTLSYLFKKFTLSFQVINNFYTTYPQNNPQAYPQSYPQLSVTY